MEKPITRFWHGIIDYKYSAVVPMLPKLVGFDEEEKDAANVCYAIGGMALSQSLLTRYELGVYKVLPFKGHLAMDVALNLFALSAPWLFGFHKNAKARNTLIGVGLQGLLVTALTQPEEMPGKTD